MNTYRMLTPGSRVTISLAELYSSKAPENHAVTTDAGHRIVHSRIDGSDYYDLDNGRTGYACCDGETVTVSAVSGGMVTFRNGNGEMPEDFTLSVAECETAIFGLK